LGKGSFKFFIILDGDGVHSIESSHLYGIANRTPSTFFEASLVSVEAVQFFSTVRKKKDFRLFDLSKGL
jgi:hypothetical protein